MSGGGQEALFGSESIEGFTESNMYQTNQEAEAQMKEPGF